jgi:single-stranded DNA-binding protein
MLLERTGWISLKGCASVLGESATEVMEHVRRGSRVHVVIDFQQERICEEHGFDYRLVWMEVDGAA